MRQIKASEVKPGMTVRWDQEDLVLQFPVERTIQFGDRHLLRTPTRKVVTIPHDTEVTVLSEPAQPEEPTAFGACVEVAGVKYVRCDDDELEWKSSDGAGWWGWSDLCDKGHVTVVNADPFATPAQGGAEPQVWERWEDVPKLTAVRIGSSRFMYRKNMGVSEVSAGNILWAESSQPNGYIEFSAPFTEVLPGA